MTLQQTNEFPFRSIFCVMDTIQYKRHKSGERVIEQTSSFYTILAVTAGQGFYYIDGAVLPVSA